MKLSFECYDALDNLIPYQEHEIISQFGCETQYVLGVWVARKDLGPNRIEPYYLTQAQLSNAMQETPTHV